MHEDGVGMARTFEAEFTGAADEVTRPRSGFFAWADGTTEQAETGRRYEAAGDLGAPADGYRGVHPRSPAWARRTAPSPAGSRRGRRGRGGGGRPTPALGAPVGILTWEAGAAVLTPLIRSLDRPDVRVLPVANEFFGAPPR